jgi:hypothetical protein
LLLPLHLWLLSWLLLLPLPLLRLHFCGRGGCLWPWWLLLLWLHFFGCGGCWWRWWQWQLLLW